VRRPFPSKENRRILERDDAGPPCVPGGQEIGLGSRNLERELVGDLLFSLLCVAAKRAARPNGENSTRRHVLGPENMRPPPPTHTPHTGFPMSAHLSRPRLFQRHLRSLGWVWVWVWGWVHTLLTRSSPSRHPPFTQYPSPSRSLVRDGQTSPHKPRLVVPHSTCPSLSPSPRTQLYHRSCSNKHTHRAHRGSLTRKRRCTCRPSVIY